MFKWEWLLLIHTFIRRDKSRPICSRALVFCWHKCFSNGHEDVDDLKLSGRPSVASERELWGEYFEKLQMMWYHETPSAPWVVNCTYLNVNCMCSLCCIYLQLSGIVYIRYICQLVKFPTYPTSILVFIHEVSKLYGHPSYICVHYSQCLTVSVSNSIQTAMVV